MSAQAEIREKRERFYPRSHREKYAEHEFARVWGVAVRKLSPQEIEEFQKAIDRGPLRLIRLDVSA